MPVNRRSIGETKQVELILSIVLAVGISYALGIFVTDLIDKAWMVLSVLSIALTITVIYFILDLKPEKSEWAMLPTLGLALLIPYSFKRMVLSMNSSVAISGMKWTQNYFFIHLLLVGVALIVWGICDREKRKNLIIAGIIWMVVIILIAVLSGEILTNA